MKITRKKTMNSRAAFIAPFFAAVYFFAVGVVSCVDENYGSAMSYAVVVLICVYLGVIMLKKYKKDNPN